MKRIGSVAGKKIKEGGIMPNERTTKDDALFEVIQDRIKNNYRAILDAKDRIARLEKEKEELETTYDERIEEAKTQAEEITEDRMDRIAELEAQFDELKEGGS